MDGWSKGPCLALPVGKMVKVACENVAGGLENTNAFLEWCQQKEIGIAFVGEAWIEKKSRGTQTQPSFVLMTTAKEGRRVITYARKGMEEVVDAVKEEDNLIILQEKQKKKIGGVYVNGRWHGEKWKECLEKLEMEMGREGSILVDGNAHSHYWNAKREEDARGKTMVEWIVGRGCTLREGDCGPMWKRTREGRRESSRIDFVSFKGSTEWSPISTTKLLSDHWAIHGEWEVDLTKKVEERVAVDWKQLD